MSGYILKNLDDMELEDLNATITASMAIAQNKMQDKNCSDCVADKLCLIYNFLSCIQEGIQYVMKLKKNRV